MPVRAPDDPGNTVGAVGGCFKVRPRHHVSHKAEYEELHPRDKEERSELRQKEAEYSYLCNVEKYSDPANYHTEKKKNDPEPAEQMQGAYRVLVPEPHADHIYEALDPTLPRVFGFSGFSRSMVYRKLAYFKSFDFQHRRNEAVHFSE